MVTNDGHDPIQTPGAEATNSGEVAANSTGATSKAKPDSDTDGMDPERRRSLLRIAGLGFGVLALRTEVLAAGFLQGPTRQPIYTCTGTATNTIYETGTFSRETTSDSVTFTTDPTCSNTWTMTTAIGPQIATYTQTQYNSGPPPSTLTVSVTCTKDYEPQTTLTIFYTCAGGTLTRTYTAENSVPCSSTHAETLSATYTYTCTEHMFRVPGGNERTIELVGSHVGGDPFDPALSVLDPATRGGRSGRYHAGL